MADTRLVTLSPEAIIKVEDSLSKMKAILDNKTSAIAMKLFTKEQLEEIQTTYDATRKMYDLYKPKTGT